MSWLPPDVVDDRRRRIVEMTTAGMNATQIAVALGVSTRTVCRAREKLGASKPRPPRMTDEDLARARQMFDDGCSAHEVSRTLGRYRSTIMAHFPGRGWTPEQAAEYQSLTRRLKAFT